MNRITTCPHCSGRLNVSEHITDTTSICPHCLSDANNPRPGFQVQPANINTDVKRGLSVGSIVLAVLIGLCVLGIALSFFAPVPREEGLDFGRLPYLMYPFAGLDVLVSIAIIRWLVSRRRSHVRTPGTGTVLGVIFLSLGTIVAVFIFFFFTCLGLGLIGTR